MVLRPDVLRTSTPSSLQFRRVFAAHSVQGTASRYGVPPPDVKWLARWLQDNFINSYENLRRGRLYVQSTTYSMHSTYAYIPPFLLLIQLDPRHVHLFACRARPRASQWPHILVLSPDRASRARKRAIPRALSRKCV